MIQSSTALDDATMGPWRQDVLQIDGLTVRFQVGGQGPQVLLLHGWGGAIESFAPVLDDLHRSYTVAAFDLPGFGQSSLPPSTWGSADYARLTLKIMDRLQMDRPHLIGHSFGGQVSIQLAATAPERVSKLVLVCSAGIRTRPALATRLKRTAARLGKWLAAHGGWIGEKVRAAIYHRVQSQDYASAGPLRPTLVRVITEDLTPLLPLITAPTLVVWGAQDRDVPLAAGQVMARLIPAAQLAVFENAGHFAYLDEFDRFRLLVRRFLREPDEQRESTFHMSLPLNLIVVALAIMVTLGWAFFRTQRALHMLQLDSYANHRLLQWLLAQPRSRLLEVPAGLCQVLFLSLALVLPTGLVDGTVLLSAWLVCETGLLLYAYRQVEPPKKPLVYTSRARRVLGMSLVISGAVMGLGTGLALSFLQPDLSTALSPHAVLVIVLAALAVIQLSPLMTVLANLILSPVQNAINRTYLRRAQHRLRDVQPLVIGITGSYGKTSTKYLLEHLLAGHRRVLKTPLSYNTLMGVCRVINENLAADTEVFIAEMGAYRQGDIKELSDFVHPTIGILTAIGPQHLERFKTIDNIQGTKYELIEALPASGVAIFNNDDPRCHALANRTTHVRVMRYGLQTSEQNLDLWAEHIAMGPEGLSFTMVSQDGRRIAVRTILLGHHNVLNILGASCAALAIGIPLLDLAKAIQELPPVPHRLQLLDNGSGVTVIDDSYNSNPIGATEALEVLGSFTTGQRILVTPGMIELGPLEAQLNEALGAKAAEVCDYVVLVGVEQTKPVVAGLKAKNFPPDKIRVVRDLKGATIVLPTIVGVGDTVLFENDLPDLYA